MPDNYDQSGSEQIVKIPLKVQNMIDNPGVYLCGDPTSLSAGLILISDGGTLYRTTPGAPLTPEGFVEGITVTGPLCLDDRK